MNPYPVIVELGLKWFSFRLTRKMRDRLTVLKFERFNRWILIGEIDDSWFSIVEFPHWIDFVDFEILFYESPTLNFWPGQFLAAFWQKSLWARKEQILEGLCNVGKLVKKNYWNWIWKNINRQSLKIIKCTQIGALR